MTLIRQSNIAAQACSNPRNKIETIENRAVIFNSQIPHGGSTTSNADNRVVLNINIHRIIIIILPFSYLILLFLMNR